MEPQREVRFDAPEPPLQPQEIFNFQRRVFADMSGALVVLAAYLGDRVGLFSALTRASQVTGADLAAQTRLNPEMTAEWLRLMTCAGYLDYEPQDETYALPPEHATVLANEGGPMFVAGGVQQVAGFANQLPALIHAFKDGGGVPQETYSQDLWEGMERLSTTWFKHELVEHWIAALPEIEKELRGGGTAADIGCGSGRALIELAKAFPAARFVGYDSFPTVVERAVRNAKAAGVADRVSFEVRDVTEGLPAQFELVTAFDSIHDMADPVAGLRILARGLKKNGILLVLELAGSENLLEEGGPIGVVHHATKLFYNLPVALASFGKAKGNAAFPESRIRDLCRKAGLQFVHAIPVRNPLHKLYAIKTRPS